MHFQELSLTRRELTGGGSDDNQAKTLSECGGDRPFALLAGAPVQLSAQTAAQTMVAIDDNDIGGVVIGANGPGSRRLGDRRDHRAADQVRARSSSPTIRAATSSPICRPRITASGCAAMAWSIRRSCTAKPGQHLNLTAVPAPNEAAAAHYYPAIYWYSMMKIPPAERVRRQEQHSRKAHAESTG